MNTVQYSHTSCVDSGHMWTSAPGFMASSHIPGSHSRFMALLGRSGFNCRFTESTQRWSEITGWLHLNVVCEEVHYFKYYGVIIKM